MKITTNPTDFIDHIAAAVSVLSEHKDEVNKLNVFPVPDGDTGTNISLTMDTVLGELSALPKSASAADVRRAITHGSLMGARGNSGVITSQILRGFCEGLSEAEAFDPKAITVALKKSVEIAFSAVRKPVEGTILTVLKDVSIAAEAMLENDVALQEFLVGLRDAAYVSVRNTPELLPVLKDNGVVDAGGYGLALMIDGFVASMTGEISVELELGMRTDSLGAVAIEQINDWDGSEYLYCTEFLFRSDDLNTNQAQDFLAEMGDCELLVGSHPDFKIHVHTDNPGKVLEYMCERGQVFEVFIHNMRIQSNERLASLSKDSDAGAPGMTHASGAPASATGTTGVDAGARSFAIGAGVANITSGVGAASGGTVAGGAGTAVAGTDGRPKQYGLIAVSSGSGMDNILESLGVDRIVSGGQTMNPSTKDLLDAIARTDAEKIFIFPNNKNIIMAATAAAEFSDKQAKVIPTISVPQCFSALFAIDQELGLDENLQAMNAAIKSVYSAEVTLAIKDAKTEKGKSIKSGDTIGLLNDRLEVVGTDVTDATLQLIEMCRSKDVDTLTILAGEDMSQDEFDALTRRIEADYPDLEVDAHRGEQPLYPIVMALE